MVGTLIGLTFVAWVISELFDINFWFVIVLLLIFKGPLIDGCNVSVKSPASLNDTTLIVDTARTPRSETLAAELAVIPKERIEDEKDTIPLITDFPEW